MNNIDRDDSPAEIAAKVHLQDFLEDSKLARMRAESESSIVALSYYEESHASAKEAGSLWQSTLAHVLYAPPVPKTLKGSDEGSEEVAASPPQSLWGRASSWLALCWQSLTERLETTATEESPEDVSQSGTPLPVAPRLQGPQLPLNRKQLDKCVEEMALALERYENAGLDTDELRQHHIDAIMRKVTHHGNMDSRRLLQEGMLLLGQQMMLLVMQNRELMEQITAIHGDILDKAQLSKVLGWVVFVLTGVVIVCGIVAYTASAIASGGAAAAPAAAAIAALAGLMKTSAAVASVSGGVTGIVKGVTDYSLSRSRGEFGEKQTNRDLNLGLMDQINGEAKSMITGAHRYASNMARHASSVRATIEMMSSRD